MNSKKNQSNIEQFDDFIVENRKNVNKAFNIIIWFCLLVAPTIGLGVVLGIFPEVNAMDCWYVTVYMFALALTHTIINRTWPSSVFSSLYVLLGIDIFLMLMSNYHMAIQLTFVVVPVMSLMFCDRKIFIIASILNYVTLAFSTMNISLYNSANRIDYSSAISWFVNYFASYTLEMIFIFITCLILLELIQGWFGKMYREQRILTMTNGRINKQLEILQSMSQPYDLVLYVDYETKKVSKVTELDNNFEYDGVEIDNINKEIIKSLDSEYVESFLKFTDLKTIQERLDNQKLLASEFLTKTNEWVRFQCVPVVVKNGVPMSVIFTAQNVDAQKRHEEFLVRITNTDELTGLCNRHCYENDVLSYSEEQMDDKLVFISADINGLKIVNDRKGHAAGDELIIGAAECLDRVFGRTGVVYRIGGDEFVAICFADEAELDELKTELNNVFANWKGKEVKELSMSIGYARSSEYPKTPIKELAKIADQKMYKEKQQHYRFSSRDRRAGSEVFRIVCDSYVKILSVNLNTDKYELIQSHVSEMVYESGYEGKYSAWIKNFIEDGYVFKEDEQEFVEKTDTEYIKEYFESNNGSLRVFYRRKTEDGSYSRVMLEAVKQPGYSQNKANVYVLVKDINKDE